MPTLTCTLKRNEHKHGGSMSNNITKHNEIVRAEQLFTDLNSELLLPLAALRPARRMPTLTLACPYATCASVKSSENNSAVTAL